MDNNYTVKETKRECKYAGKCGACQTLNLSYERELSLKMKKEIALLGKFGHIEEIIPMDDPTHYRAKLHYLFRFDRNKVICGLYRSSDNRVTSITSCLSEDEEAASVVHTVKKLVEKYHITVFDDKNHKGLLRSVLVRKSFSTGEILCSLITGKGEMKNGCELAKELNERNGNVKYVSRIINDTEMPLWTDGNEEILFGNGYIYDEMCGCRFRISAKSFCQINPRQTEKLYSEAVRLADIKKNTAVMDTFCGTGTIGIIAAKNGCASLFGFDINADAVKDAENNAKLNNIKAKYICSDDKHFAMKSEKYLTDKVEYTEKVIFADPPRSGCSESFIKFVIEQNPDRFVYISCNPETLARDLKLLKGKFKIKTIQPVDMFPGTGHVETVVLMSRKEK